MVGMEKSKKKGSKHDNIGNMSDRQVASYMYLRLSEHLGTRLTAYVP